MFKYITNFICKIILYTIGWEISFNYDKFKINKKAILIYPHSSYFDYFISILYTSQLDYNMYTIVSERFLPFNIKGVIPAPDKYIRYYMSKGYSRFQAFCQCWKNTIFRTKVEVENMEKTGYVNYLYDYLKDMDEFKLLISPTGSVSEGKWKSGYYHIAKKLNVPIIVTGVDYKLKTCIVKDVYNYKDLHPSNENNNRVFQDINTYHTCKKINVINWSCVINILSLFTKVLNCIYNKEYIKILFYTIFNLHIYYYLRYNMMQDLITFSFCKLFFTIVSFMNEVNYKSYIYLSFIVYHHLINILYPILNGANSTLELFYLGLMIVTNY
jgi:hypothetical protein